jgi:hypothetical protein
MDGSRRKRFKNADCVYLTGYMLQSQAVVTTVINEIAV